MFGFISGRMWNNDIIISPVCVCVFFLQHEKGKVNEMLESNIFNVVCQLKTYISHWKLDEFKLSRMFYECVFAVGIVVVTNCTSKSGSNEPNLPVNQWILIKSYRERWMFNCVCWFACNATMVPKSAKQILISAIDWIEYLFMFVCAF